MSHRLFAAGALAVLTVVSAACTVHNTEAPALSGPSEFALSVGINAIPDTISQDGGSQASIKVTAFGPDGKPMSGVPFRVDMRVNGVVQDFGVLSARTIVTGSDGVATVVYTAPPSPVGGNSGTCGALPGTCVAIVATPTGTNFVNAVSQSVLIRLVPPGVILPPAGTPSPCFTTSPSVPTSNVAVQFTARTQVGATCSTATSDLVTFSWNFGDGGSGSGKTVSHTFTSANTFTVSLTEINDRGISATNSQSVAVGSAALPTASFNFSPQAPGVNETVFFNADASTAGAGHTIGSYRWSFGDGGTGSGATASHAYATTGSYTATLTVVDEAGQSASATQTVGVGISTPGPTANFTSSPAAPIVGQSIVFDASSSSTAQGQTIVKLVWNFGDSTPLSTCPGDAACNGTRIISHTYTAAGSYFVNLVVTDSAGRVASKSNTVTVK